MSLDITQTLTPPAPDREERAMTTRLRIRRIPKVSGSGYWPGWMLHEIGDAELNSAEWFQTFQEALARADAQLSEATA